MSAHDRSSPDGPIIMAQVSADVEGTNIVAWKNIGSLFRDVGPDGEIQPLDTRLAVAIAGALLSDALVSGPSVVGINSKIVERRRAKEERKIPADLHASAFARAKMQILDRLNGSKAVGVRLYPAGDDTANQQQA
jgi:hypothetical protein